MKQAKAKPRQIYRILFRNQDALYELYARKLNQGTLFGFLEIEDIVFGERSNVLVDPGEERLKAEFSRVRRTHIPIQAVVRIDEVEKPGAARILGEGEKASVTPFPFPLTPPRPVPDKR
jgi:hypothetical protein